jgi:integrase/ribosomal protein L37AE/L43A
MDSAHNITAQGNREDERSKDPDVGNQNVSCPKCENSKLWRSGFYRERQRWLCRTCGYRFSKSEIEVNVSPKVVKVSEPVNDLAHDILGNFDSSLEESLNDFSLLGRENVASHECTVVGQRLNIFRDCYSNRRISASEREAKNLTEVATVKNGRQARGVTADIKGKIVEYMWFLKKEGKAESTITRRVRYLKTISKRGGNLLDPESIKRVIAQQENWKTITKEHAVTTYSSFLKMLGKKWTPPKYNRVRKMPFIPQEKEVNDLISGCNRKTCAFLRLLKETGMRSGEAWQLEWTDLNFEHKTVSVTPEKGSNPRVLPISTELIAMLNGLQKKSSRVFDGSLRHFRRTFRKQRKKVAEKLKNPRIN